MTLTTRLDLFKLSTALGIVTLSLFTAACTMVAATKPVREVEMLAIPGDGRAVPMPPFWMRQQIERRMASGDVPGYVEKTPGDLRKACHVFDHLLGCMVNFHGLKVTYVRAGLTAEQRHMVLIHEYAHDLYDWKH